MRAKRSLSQNFLVDPNVGRKLVDALECTATTTILEIGPGRGALTDLLVERGHHVVAIEKDDELAQLLQNRYAAVPTCTIMNADVLDVDLTALGLEPRTTSILSNLPYGVTSPILFHVIESRLPVRSIVVTMQKEVALRLVAPPGSKTYGRLSVALALYGATRRLFDLPPTVFRPRPSVMSSAVRIAPEPDRWLEVEAWRQVTTVVGAAFSSRRKMVGSCLTRVLDLSSDRVGQACRAAGFEPTRRAETLSSDDFISLTRSLFPS